MAYTLTRAASNEFPRVGNPNIYRYCRPADQFTLCANDHVMDYNITFINNCCPDNNNFYTIDFLIFRSIECRHWLITDGCIVKKYDLIFSPRSAKVLDNAYMELIQREYQQINAVLYLDYIDILPDIRSYIRSFI